MSFNSRVKSTKDHRSKETFYRKRIPESSCARKKIVDIDILVTSGNGEKSCNLSE